MKNKIDMGQIELEPMKHLLEARKCLSEAINEGLSLSGCSLYYNICQAQSNIQVAIKQINELKGGKEDV